MEKKSYLIECKDDMSAEELIDALEALSEASHFLYTCAIRGVGKHANEPDMQALVSCAGSANVACHYARVIAGGGMVPSGASPFPGGRPN